MSRGSGLNGWGAGLLGGHPLLDLAELGPDLGLLVALA